jgi:integrase/recombinase XerD
MKNDSRHTDQEAPGAFDPAAEQSVMPRGFADSVRTLSFDRLTHDVSWSLPPARPLQFPSVDHFRQAAERAIAHAREVDGLQPATLRWAKRSYESFASFLIDTNLSRDFLSGEVERQLRVLAGWIAWQRQRGLSRTTINTTWRGLASVCRWLSRAEGTVNPFRYTKPPRPQNKQPRYLTKESAERVLTLTRNYQWNSDLVRSRNIVMIGLMLLAGLRIGELPRLECADVDPVNGTIRIRAGKGPDGGKDRTAYMPPQLQAMVGAYLDARKRAHRTHPEFLTDARRDRGISTQPIRHLCETISRAMRVPFSPHALRHTYATLLRKSGVPDRVAMELLGHTSLVMLQRYSHVFEGEHQQEAAKLHLDIRL